MKYEELKVSSYEISLAKLIQKPIRDIRGYLSTEFDDPVFMLTKVEFEDGTFLGCEGEHDMPYLVQWRESDQPNYTDEVLWEVYKTSPDYEGEEE